MDDIFIEHKKRLFITQKNNGISHAHRCPYARATYDTLSNQSQDIHGSPLYHCNLFLKKKKKKKKKKK